MFISFLAAASHQNKKIANRLEVHVKHRGKSALLMMINKRKRKQNLGRLRNAEAQAPCNKKVGGGGHRYLPVCQNHYTATLSHNLLSF